MRASSSARQDDISPCGGATFNSMDENVQSMDLDRLISTHGVGERWEYERA